MADIAPFRGDRLGSVWQPIPDRRFSQLLRILTPGGDATGEAAVSGVDGPRARVSRGSGIKLGRW